MKSRDLLTSLAVTAALGLSACATRQYVLFENQPLNGRQVFYDESRRTMVLMERNSKTIELITDKHYPSVLSSEYDKEVKLSEVNIWQDGKTVIYTPHGKRIKTPSQRIGGHGDLTKISNSGSDAYETQEALKNGRELFLKVKREIREKLTKDFKPIVHDYLSEKQSSN